MNDNQSDEQDKTLTQQTFPVRPCLRMPDFISQGRIKPGNDKKKNHKTDYQPDNVSDRHQKSKKKNSNNHQN